MPVATSELLRCPLPIPPSGKVARLRRGDLQLVVERSRRGLALLINDGQDVRRHVLGLPTTGRLMLVLRTPGEVVQVAPREVLALAPGARLKGYLRVRLPMQLAWERPDQPDEPLIELAPMDWNPVIDPRSGVAVQRTSSRFALDPHPRRDVGCVSFPIIVRNLDSAAHRPAWLPIRMESADLMVRRERVIGRARRLVVRGADTIEEQVRERDRRLDA